MPAFRWRIRDIFEINARFPVCHWTRQSLTALHRLSAIVPVCLTGASSADRTRFSAAIGAKMCQVEWLKRDGAKPIRTMMRNRCFKSADLLAGNLWKLITTPDASYYFLSLQWLQLKVAHWGIVVVRSTTGTSVYCRASRTYAATAQERTLVFLCCR